MQLDFHLIKRLPPYVFDEVNRMMARARLAGADIIDFGMGNPDSPTPPHIVDKLVETVANSRTHGYSASRGIPGLRKALAAYYDRRFGVDIDPDDETVVTLGSKEGLAHLGLGFGEYGDGHVRIALVENEQRIRQACRSIKTFMAYSDSLLEPIHGPVAAASGG